MFSIEGSAVFLIFIEESETSLLWIGFYLRYNLDYSTAFPEG
jgi:hypothetical protein